MVVGVKSDNPYVDPKSLESSFRRKRFVHIERILTEIVETKGSVSVLDMGGTETYWSIADDLLQRLDGKIRIHLVNPEPQTIQNEEIFSFQLGDACCADLLQGEKFDLVHSNSVIEHVGGWYRMEMFAKNVMRLGDRFFVQTPNYWFPLEPHFRYIGFQWLPLSLRTRLLQRRSLGFYSRQPDFIEARKIVDEIRLLSAHEMSKLFEGANIIKEKVFGLDKSIMAVSH